MYVTTPLIYEYIQTVEEIELDDLSNEFIKRLVSNLSLRRMKLIHLNDCHKLSTLVMKSQSLESLELTSTFLASYSFPFLCQGECSINLGLNALSLKQMKSLSSNFEDIRRFFRSLVFSLNGAGSHLSDYGIELGSVSFFPFPESFVNALEFFCIRRFKGHYTRV